MPLTYRQPLDRSCDLLVTEEAATYASDGAGALAPKRPSPLKQFLGLVGNAMISAEAPLRARSAAGKVFQRLLRTSPISMSGHELAPDLKASFKIALKSLGKCRDDFGAMATLNDLQPRIRWSIGKTGSLASRNFENSQSHSVVVGPGGMEERGDFRIGLTLMESYGHVPDHTSSKPRSYFFLPPTEYCGEENGWRKVAVGSVLHSEQGEWVAFR